MKNLRFVSALILSVIMVGCTASRMSTLPVDSAVVIVPVDTIQQYRLTIHFGKQNITGILMIRHSDCWKGNVMNEFGISAFDFTVTDRKCKIQHAVSYLNKWYIRRTIESDFLFLLAPSQRPFMKSRKVETEPDGTIRLINTAHSIQYILNKI